MEHYVTLFDSKFLPQGLALHSSLSRHAGSFMLWVLCMDRQTKDFLDSLQLASLRTIDLEEAETDELRSVKSQRTRGEYCWTLTPFTTKFVFDRAPEAARVTYVDSDLYFLKPPTGIFDEFERSGKAVLITDHAYDPEYDQTAASGQYCVQFVTFVRDSSEVVRRWWQERCIEWCYARYEAGKFGDQKYLDDWPVRFGSLVHVLQQQQLFMAPWNARRFPYSGAVAWHFHGLRLLKKRRALLHLHYSVPEVVHRMIYEPYLKELHRGMALIGEEIIQLNGSTPLVYRSLEAARLAKRALEVLVSPIRVVRTLRD